MGEIKEDVKEATWEVVDWIHLDLNRAFCEQVFVLSNLRVLSWLTNYSLLKRYFAPWSYF
jgi:hypothetical protein